MLSFGSAQNCWTFVNVFMPEEGCLGIHHTAAMLSGEVGCGVGNIWHHYFANHCNHSHLMTCASSELSLHSPWQIRRNKRLHWSQVVGKEPLMVSFFHYLLVPSILALCTSIYPLCYKKKNGRQEGEWTGSKMQGLVSAQKCSFGAMLIWEDVGSNREQGIFDSGCD